MPFKRTSTSAAPAMTQAAIWQLVADSVATALEAQATTMASTDNLNRNTGPRKLFNCTEDCKVKFATGTLTKNALSWWNSYAKLIGLEQANKIAWTELKRLLTNKYCPRTEVKKIKDEFYNLVVKGNDLKTYARSSKNWQFYMPSKRTSTSAAPAMTQAAICNCTEDCKVKFATGTLTKNALSWWNSYAKLIGLEQANKIA
nr:reverse transcriptase domain-containing protein [Tanacetum cinerariifolium]